MTGAELCPSCRENGAPALPCPTCGAMQAPRTVSIPIKPKDAERLRELGQAAGRVMRAGGELRDAWRALVGATKKGGPR